MLQPRSRKLERERHAVEPPTDLQSGLVGLERRPHGSGALDEKLQRVLFGEWRHRQLVLARKTERRSARDQHLHPRRRREQLADQRRRRDHVLEVVEE